MNGFATWLRRLAGRHDGADPDSARHEGAVILVGSPNVGKSQLFNRLTGRYVTVSNYPGTTVEVARGRLRAAGGTWELVDTPGIYSLNAITAEEQVTCDYLFSRDVRAVMHVVDAKNLERMLPLTLQLAEAGLPLLLVLNMADEAADLGIRIDVGKLRDLLGLPVVRTVATRGSGLKRLLRLLPQARRGAPLKIDYGAPIEGALAELRRCWSRPAPGASRRGRWPCCCCSLTRWRARAC